MLSSFTEDNGRYAETMENTALVGVSHQAALRRQMETIANNIANMNTTGFKSERIMFVDHLVRNPGDDQRHDPKLSFVRDVATVRDLSSGTLKHTGNPFDLAIEGDGFFVVQTPDGDRYTRNGRLRLDDTGQMVTDHGMPVLTAGGQPVVLSSTDTEITISRDGTISSENGVLGRFRVVRFDNQQNLRVVAEGMMASDEPPQDMDTPRLVQGMLEGSNVESVVEMTRMIEVHRAYDRTSKLISGEHERIRKMMQVYAS